MVLLSVAAGMFLPYFSPLVRTLYWTCVTAMLAAGASELFYGLKRIALRV